MQKQYRKALPRFILSRSHNN